LPDNTHAKYNDHGERIGMNEAGSRKLNDIISDISTSFVVLIGIVFPAVTGILDKTYNELALTLASFMKS
jgi:potassium/chloride transporter 4/5/6